MCAVRSWVRSLPPVAHAIFFVAVALVLAVLMGLTSAALGLRDPVGLALTRGIGMAIVLPVAALWTQRRRRQQQRHPQLGPAFTVERVQP